MRREDDQELWDLLARAPGPRLSDFFARDVIRRLRQEPGRVERVRQWLAFRWFVPVSGAAASMTVALIIAVTGGQHRIPPAVAADSEPAVVAKIDPRDYDVVADLDELLAADETTLWNDDQSL
jgi:hypothetical protein